ncbi:hypothetical protein KDL01_04255 [Actinospica durhamensis]|uniref:Uncharacterized protein n=1 Tax=Actinospica durhamensis TaxID=1508375 RepID=A0A941IL08_9ACTN|nr:hypothetical protein [Actinospica durhamensis]MBR7832455.1 hypothetical protein [Actinospica durhamensis]
MTERTAAQKTARRARLVTVGLLVPAAMGLALSASTSYRFAQGRLGITDFAERVTLCGTAEAAIIALTLHSWGTKSKASAWLAYILVAVQAVPAFSVSGGTGGIVRIVLGPILLAVMLHKLLGLEMKLSGEKSTGLLASAGREIRERLTARLGIGRRGADSAAIARSRAADKAVWLATRRRWTRRSHARLGAALDAAQHGLDAADAAAAEASIVARIVRRNSVTDLRRLTARHVWMSSAVSGVAVIEPQAGEIAEADTAEDTQGPAEPVISGWTGPRVSGRRRPRRVPRTLRPARTVAATQTAPERPEAVLEPVRVDTVETESTVPPQGAKRRPSVRPAVIALKAQNPDMATDTIAEILGVAERTVTRHLSAKDAQIQHANGTTN